MPEGRRCVRPSSVDDHAKVGLYRLEVGTSPGTGKLKIAGGVEGPMRESINRAFAYLMGQKVKMGIGQQVDTTDFHVEALDLLSNQVPCEAGIALVVAIYSALKRQPVLAGLVILGDLSIQGNIKQCVRWPSRCRLRWTTAHGRRSSRWRTNGTSSKSPATPWSVLTRCFFRTR